MDKKKRIISFEDETRLGVIEEDLDSSPIEIKPSHLRRKESDQPSIETKNNVFVQVLGLNDAPRDGKTYEVETRERRLKVPDDDKADKPHIFEKHTLEQVLDAIIDKKVIDEINIFEEIKKPGFRFQVLLEPNISAKVSEVLSLQNQSYSVNPEVSAMGREKMKSNADEFAIKMYDMIQQIQNEKKLSTYRATAKALNDKKIPTYTGKLNWDGRTVQNLEKRWEKLGLIQAKPDQ